MTLAVSVSSRLGVTIDSRPVGGPSACSRRLAPTSSVTDCHPTGSRMTCSPGTVPMISETSSPEMVFLSSSAAANSRTLSRLVASSLLVRS